MCCVHLLALTSYLVLGRNHLFFFGLVPGPALRVPFFFFPTRYYYALHTVLTLTSC